MNNVFTLVGLFMGALGRDGRQLLTINIHDSDSANDFELVETLLTDMVFDLSATERDEWIDLIINQGACPAITMYDDKPVICL